MLLSFIMDMVESSILHLYLQQKICSINFDNCHGWKCFTQLLEYPLKDLTNSLPDNIRKKCTWMPTEAVNWDQAGQSSWSKGSSIDTTKRKENFSA